MMTRGKSLSLDIDLVLCRLSLNPLVANSTA